MRWKPYRLSEGPSTEFGTILDDSNPQNRFVPETLTLRSEFCNYMDIDQYVHRVGRFGERPTFLSKRRLPGESLIPTLFSAVLLIVVFCSGANALAQPPDITPKFDSVWVADSIARLDSIRMAADTIQPELRLGMQVGGLTTTASLENIDLEPQARTGFQVGIRGEMEFAYPVFFLVELEYAQRGLETSYETRSGIEIQEKYHFNYLGVPIIYRMGVPIAGRHELSFGLGVNLNFLVASSQIIQIGEFDSVNTFVEGIESFDYGIEGRVGWEYPINEKLRVHADFRYLHGLQNILILASLNDDRSWKSRSSYLTVGFTYQLQRSIRR